jgi:glucosamine--fructose-6-phosphate aminotransferase (isomerizing)
MGNDKAQMAQEIREAPLAILRQEQSLAEPLAELLARLQRRPPQVVVCLRRSAASHRAYLGIPLPQLPSIASIYGRSLHLKDQLFLAISQSGRSDDLVALTTSAKKSGALTVAITNVTDAPLAATCDFVLPICAGPELSVAATKTFVATLAALARLTAAWADNDALGAAVGRLPDRLRRRRADGRAVPALADAVSLAPSARLRLASPGKPPAHGCNRR